MTTVQEKTLMTMSLLGTCPTHARTHVVAARHEIVIDEPISRGGTDMAPTPLETMIAALIGCTNVILNKIAKRDSVTIDGLSVNAVATLDRRGVTLQEEIAVPFPEIVLTIDFRTDVDDAHITRLKSDLGRFCPLSKILRQAGTRIEDIWRVTRR